MSKDGILEESPRQTFLKDREELRNRVESALFNNDTAMNVWAEQVLFALNYDNDRESFYSIINWWIQDRDFYKRDRDDADSRRRLGDALTNDLKTEIKLLRDEKEMMRRENVRLVGSTNSTNALFPKYSKIALIKLIRQLFHTGLRDSKHMMDMFQARVTDRPTNYNWNALVRDWNADVCEGQVEHQLYIHE